MDRVNVYLRFISISGIIYVPTKASANFLNKLQPEVTSHIMAERCSVCHQGIKITSGTPKCPGSGNTANEPGSYKGDDEVPLLYLVVSA